MIRYLKKQWRLSTLTCLFAIIAYGAQALIQLALMKVFPFSNAGNVIAEFI